MDLPTVTLKLATSLDGRIALANGVSQWITGNEARARLHQMRTQHDAILVGIGTVLADDPLLTARTVPLPQSQPMRIVADSHGRTPVYGRLVQSAGLGPVKVASSSPDRTAVDVLMAAGADVWRCGDGNGRVSPHRLLDQASSLGVKTIFLEGGGQLAASFIAAGLVDQIAWFRAPVLVGGDGAPAVTALGLTKMDAAPRWKCVSTETVGEDILEHFKRG